MFSHTLNIAIPVAFPHSLCCHSPHWRLKTSRRCCFHVVAMHLIIVAACYKFDFKEMGSTMRSVGCTCACTYLQHVTLTCWQHVVGLRLQ